MVSRRGAIVAAAVTVAAAAGVFATRTGDDSRVSLAGRYETSFKEYNGNVDLVRLTCPDEQHCTFTWTTAAANFSDPERTFNHVEMTDKFDANVALRDAVEHRDEPALPDHTGIAARLAPTLRSSPQLATCWDLDHGSAPRMLEACRLRVAGRRDPRLYVFFNNPFCDARRCRFDIIPLDEKRG